MTKPEWSKRKTSLVGRVVAETVALTDIVCRSLFGGEVGFNPSDGVGTEQQSPNVAVDAVKKSCGREAPSTPGNATNEVLCIDDGGRVPAHGDPYNSRMLSAANSLTTNDLGPC